MNIKMLKSEKGSIDGISVKLYEKDNEYEVNDELGNAFIKGKFAVLAAVKEEVKSEAKVIEPDFNKMDNPDYSKLDDSDIMDKKKSKK